MIKLLKKHQIQLTAFNATKNWSLNSINNEDVLLYESTGSEDGYPIALEFTDYSSTGSFYNYNCNIALEHQESDIATLNEGQKTTGLFYSETDPINDDGTYKRPIYNQIKTMFYNSYIDPTKIWGMENIDFQSSNTKRILSDKFRLITIPNIVFGEKMLPNTIIMYDNTLDNVYTISDDGNGNLFAGKNLFSHQQELGEYKNEYISYLSSSNCDYF